MHEINRSIQQHFQFDAANVFELDYRKEKNYVFGKPDGSKFSTGYISKLFREFLRKAGMDGKFHFHCLRHTALTNMANAGIPAFMIKEIAGHSDIKTTQGYVHPSLNEMRNILDNMDFCTYEQSII
jgi:integrase